MKLTFKQLNECIKRVNALETELTPEQLHAIISEQFTQELNEGPTWDKIKSAGKAVIKGAAKVIGGDEDDNAKKITALKAKKAALTAEKLKKINLLFQ